MMGIGRRILGRSKRRIAGLTAMGCGLLLCWPWFQAEGVDPKSWQKGRGGPDEPIEIRAERMELRKKEDLAVYSGNVVVTQAEYRMRSQELEVRWDAETKKIHLLVARGEVRLDMEDASATCGRAILDVSTRSVEMRESPKMVQGGEHVEGDRIVYSIGDRKSTVLGGQGGRVRTLVVPGARP
jgi:lipopolysaccharide export system protein LptA